MNSDTFGRLAKLLTDYNLIIRNEIVPDQLKCVRCKTVLKDACQVPCGCRVCRICISTMMQSNCQFCPGPSEECRESLLSFFVIDYNANQKISKLIARCPRDNCLHECELIDMENHFRLCTGKSVTCPFSPFGCQADPIGSCDIDKHFQVEQVGHGQILIELINNVNNEMAGLRRDQRTKSELETLQSDAALRNGEIRVMTEQIEVVKHDIELLQLDIQSIKHRESAGRYPQLNEEIGLMKAEHESLKTEIEALSISTDNNERKIAEWAATTEEMCQHMSKQWKLWLDLELAKIAKETKEYRQLIGSRLDTVEKSVNRLINGYLVWTLDMVDRRGGIVYSDYFYGIELQYKFQLSVSYDNSRLLLRVRLFVHAASDRDSELSWPFRGLVTIVMSDSCRPKLWKSVSKHCQIDRPPDNSYKRSEDFTFEYSDWAETGGCQVLTVTCLVYLDAGGSVRDSL